MRLICPKCGGEIDKELIPLIKELNKLGLRTKSSCSGHDGNYWCEFGT
jgi:tRNA(Phe) wybutosine-synthesizing methylase Tyw3